MRKHGGLTARVSLCGGRDAQPDLLVESLCTFAGAQPERCEIRRTCLLGEKGTARACR